MLDHVSFSIKNYEASIKFYDETLKILGYSKDVELEVTGTRIAGYGNGGIRPSLWIGEGGHSHEEIGKAKGFHLSFIAPTKEAVDAWYNKSLELGGQDNGKPGPRTH